MNEMCLLHPDRESITQIVGLAVCDECLRHYSDERREQQGFNQRPFYQQLQRAYHKLGEFSGGGDEQRIL